MARGAGGPPFNARQTTPPLQAFMFPLENGNLKHVRHLKGIPLTLYRGTPQKLQMRLASPRARPFTWLMGLLTAARGAGAGYK